MPDKTTKEKQIVLIKKESTNKDNTFKVLIKKGLIKIIRLCYSLHEKVNKKLISKKENQLEDFSPAVLTNEDDKYSHIIKEVIENKNVKNLALTGPHGSGKSTILNTFKHNHIEYKYLDISLATFNGEKFEPEDIERNILKQLFYSVEHKKIPESRIKRIESIKRIKIKTFLFLLWLASTSYFFKIEFINKLKSTFHINYYNKIFSIFYGIYFVVGFIYLLQKVVNFILNFKLTKFKFSDIDFDDNRDKKTINFENEIDEIIYFFEMNKIDIVFIQDLDRFNESEIFIKLREINNLINNYEPIKNNRKITFIYAISDDVFKNDERTKFFDLIIPVIPVINYSNSSSKLLEKLLDDINNKKISKDFIDEVSLFINDYRTIKSIINEYNVYKKIIGKELENYNNLLAIMIYKNIEPKDFEKLNTNKGYVYDILNNSFKLTDNSLQTIDEKVKELNNEIKVSKNENVKNIQELRMLYIYKFFELLNKSNHKHFYRFSIDNETISWNEIISDENFSKFISLRNITYYQESYDYIKTSSNISFSDIEKTFKEKYLDRVKVIENKNNPNKIKKELNELEIRKNEITTKKFFELINDYNSIAYFNEYSENERNSHINNLKLINYLLITGHLNEDYNHYISYFHPGSITKEDNDFLISLLPSEKSLPYSYKLYEINSLVSKIKLADYSKVSILNFSLLDYLIEVNNLEKINLIIKLLKKQNKISIQFIDQYLEKTNDFNKQIFLINISNKFPEFWNIIILKSNLSFRKIDLYLQYLFSFIDIKTIEIINKNHEISEYLSEIENLDFTNNITNKTILQTFLKNTQIEFKNLNYKEEHKDLFDFIYDEYIYYINSKMIEQYLSDYYNNKEIIENFKTSNYTTILQSKKEKLINHLNLNINNYLNNILLKLDNNNNESQESILLILNNSEVIEKTKIEFIDKINSIKELSKIKDLKIREILLNQNKIDINWFNIIIFYIGENAFNDILVNYLNIEEHYKLLSKNKINYSDENVKNNFVSDLINSNISLVSFSDLINSIPFYYPDGNQFSEIDEAKMNLLIESKTIRLTKENFEMIYEKFENLLILLLEKNLTTYMNDYENYNLSYSNIIAIIDSKIFKPNQKKIIIENVDEKILISNKDLLLKLGDFLLNNKIIISQRTLEEIISSSKNLSNKVKITNLYFDTFKKENIRNIIIQIGLPISKLLIGKHVEIENTVENQELISNLKKYLISSTKNNDKKNTVKLIPFKNLTI